MSEILEELAWVVRRISDDAAEVRRTGGDPERERYTKRECLNFLRIHHAAIEQALKDAERLTAIVENSWDLRCFDMPTGGGDADIGWQVFEHYRTEPCLRVISVEYSDDPRKAIDAAMAREKNND